MIVWVQYTTGVVHKRRNCMVTRRTRYRHVEVEMTEAQLAKRRKCGKCWA